MSKRISTSFRLPIRTREQLSQLAERLGATHTQTLILAVDRMHREELACLQTMADAKLHLSVELDPSVSAALASERRAQLRTEKARASREERATRNANRETTLYYAGQCFPDPSAEPS